jgi:hypothetical protein
VSGGGVVEALTIAGFVVGFAVVLGVMFGRWR